MKAIINKLNLNDDFITPPEKSKRFNKVKVVPKKSYNYQADLLYLPKTKEGYLYLLVVVDLATKNFDCEPMKNKEASTTLEAFKTMFKRKYIKKPEISVRTDNGKEFLDEFSKYLHDNNIYHSITEPYRHSQTSSVEAVNKQLGYLLNLYMNTKELEKNETYNEWTDILDEVRTELNKHREVKLPSYKNWKLKLTNIKEIPNTKYQINDVVYYKLEIPKNALNNNQNTKNFRVGDIRWSTAPRKIINIIHMPDKPFIRYILEGKNNVSYSENELMKSSEKESKYFVEKFLKVKTVKGKKQYLVKWKGYKVQDATFETEEALIEDIGKDLFDKYVKAMKK